MLRAFRFIFLVLFASVSLNSAEESHDTLSENGYTINYNTISILEYIRFASKISNTNFIYNKDELNFSISVISDAPITSENVMATLIQVLRIHGLSLIEQNGSLLIHKSSDVKQIATLVTGSHSDTKAPIVTRVFRIQNAKPDSIAAIIRPMISGESLLETSPETRQIIITDVTANVDKVASLIEILDSPYTPLDIQSYAVENNKLDFLVETANQIMAPITQGNPFILVPQPLAESIFIVSTPELVQRALAVFRTVDSPPREGMSSKKITPDNMLIFNAKHRSGSEILSALRSIGATITQSGVSEGDLVETIDSGKFIPQTNALMFVGSVYSLAKTKEFLTALDTPSEFSTDSFFIYKPLHRNAGELEQALREIGNNLKSAKELNSSLIDTIESVKVNPLTNTLLFSGDPANFQKVKDLLGKMDSQMREAGLEGRDNFLIYKIQHAPFSAIESALKYFAANLDDSNPSESGLITAIQEMKQIEETNSILFTGSDLSLKKLQELVPSFDKNISFPQVTNQLFIYKPKNQKEESFFLSVREVTEDLKKNRFTDPSFLQALQSMKWMRGNGSFLFTGDAIAIKKVEELTASLDRIQEQQPARRNYYIYKLQNTTAETIEEDFDNLLKSFKASGMKDTKLIEVIENMRHVKETNSFLVTGDPHAIEEAKQLLQDYDYPRIAMKAAQSNFLMIKPQHVSAPQLEKSLREVALSLKQADLADPNLLAAIESIKYIEATNSLLFTGTPDSLQKLQILIKDVDTPQQSAAGIQHVGKTSFLLYKLKNGTGTQVVNSIKTLSADLKKSGASDKDFVNALQSAKYIRETQSILFTGNEESLKKVESFAAQFDIVGACPAAPESDECPAPATDFLSYKPVALSGPDLETVTHDFAENLKISGLVDTDLFSALASMRWVPQSQSLIFTGTPKALQQVKLLVISFDIPSNAPPRTHPDGSLDNSIQTGDSSNFLVYKLQFHKGDEIQMALKQISKDLASSGAVINVNLLNAINSIQWIQITNSLLASGDQDILIKLRELMKSLDVPLKQVFIEMLVIETNLLNALEFGLEWGGKYKYRDKFQGSINNITIPSSGGSCNIPDALNSLNNYKPTSPMPSITEQIPFGCGFDLGIIGQVIKHNGQTFLTLGSLLSALQQDNETSVILTPKIITQDGRTSTIFVGSNVPYVGSYVNTSGQNTVQTSNVEYRDVGLNLSVTPVLGNSDIVTLDISLDRSQTVTNLNGNQIDFSASTASGIVTSKTNMQTTVHVPDKNFLILSGFVNNSTAKSTSGIPCLGGLPFIGAAFSKDNNTSNNQNIVIFLRPHVINSLDDLRNLTEVQEEAFRDQQGTPFLLHQFDDAMELIKTIDDN